ncbi:MAG: hypothetical protein R3C11_12795 [Planctomycetaceae bacterium]
MATSNHNNEVAQIRESMQRIRCELQTDVEQVRESASQLTSWQYYVRKYPWACVGAATALGALVVPKRKHVVNQIDADSLRNMISNLKLTPKSQQEEVDDAEKSGFMKGMVTFVTGLALKAATNHVMNNYITPGFSSGRTYPSSSPVPHSPAEASATAASHRMGNDTI